MSVLQNQPVRNRSGINVSASGNIDSEAEASLRKANGTFILFLFLHCLQDPSHFLFVVFF